MVIVYVAFFVMSICASMENFGVLMLAPLLLFPVGCVIVRLPFSRHRTFHTARPSISGIRVQYSIVPEFFSRAIFHTQEIPWSDVNAAKAVCVASDDSETWSVEFDISNFPCVIGEPRNFMVSINCSSELNAERWVESFNAFREQARGVVSLQKTTTERAR